MDEEQGGGPRRARWTRSYPVPAALAVGAGAYVLFGTTLTAGGVEPGQAWGVSSVIGALIVAFVAWAVFTRPEERRRRPGRSHDPDDGEPPAA